MEGMERTFKELSHVLAKNERLEETIREIIKAYHESEAGQIVGILERALKREEEIEAEQKAEDRK